jgi:acid phosphatase (class A)
MLTKKLHALLPALLTLLCSAPAFADWTRIQSAEFELKDYPQEGSEAYRKDFEILHRYKDERTKADCDLASRQEQPGFEAMFENRESPLSKKEAAESAELVGQVMKLALKVSNYHKNKFHRTRPYDTDPSIEPCGRVPGGEKSYPSSHASTSMAGACILAVIYPEKSKEILQYGKSLGELRVKVGVHHPSDVAAGQKLGNDVCERVQEEADFRRELKSVRE